MQNIITNPLSLLPKNFDYYAGGHVHIVDSTKIDGYGLIAYPGPLFPNSFSELETAVRLSIQKWQRVAGRREIISPQLL